MGSRRRGKIKSRKPSKAAGIRSQEPTQYNQACIKFSFEYTLEDGRGSFNNLNQMQKAHIVSAMIKRRKQKWSDLISADKHALGLEKIAKDAIKTSMKELPRDLQDKAKFIAFRYHEKMAMVGFRDKDVFYTLWFDANFHNKSVYGH